MVVKTQYGKPKHLLPLSPLCKTGAGAVIMAQKYFLHHI